MATVATQQPSVRGMSPRWVALLMVVAAATGAGAVALLQGNTTEGAVERAAADHSLDAVIQSRTVNEPTYPRDLEFRFNPKAVLDSKALNLPTYPSRASLSLSGIGDGRALNEWVPPGHASFVLEGIRHGRALNRPDR